ncbi:MAG TPA: substrate-binding domain-containing protein [Candidatus Acidoferrum sp.]|nr:substrate-binding domain-containing protein [Candidatus Acidoferrum sp.]
MQSRRTLSFILSVCVVLGAASCQKPYHDEKERYVFVATNIKLPYWQEAEAGLRDGAQQLGVKAELVGPENFDAQEELRAFQKTVSENPAGILVSVARPDLFQDAINAAVANGIPVVTVDSDAPDSRHVMFVGTDNFRAGQESGKRMGEILKGKGNVVIITIPGQLNLDERARGVNEALKKYPGVKIIQTLDDNGDPRVANDSISALIKGKANFEGVLCLEASGGSGAAEALHRLDLQGKIPVVAFDKDPNTLDWIDRGVINATIAQKPYVMSYYGLKFVDDLHHNAVHEFKEWRTAPSYPLPKWVDTGTAVVDKSNLATFREALAAHPKPM